MDILTRKLLKAFFSVCIMLMLTIILPVSSFAESVLLKTDVTPITDYATRIPYGTSAIKGVFPEQPGYFYRKISIKPQGLAFDTSIYNSGYSGNITVKFVDTSTNKVIATSVLTSFSSTDMHTFPTSKIGFSEINIDIPYVKSVAIVVENNVLYRGSPDSIKLRSGYYSTTYWLFDTQQVDELSYDTYYNALTAATNATNAMNAANAANTSATNAYTAANSAKVSADTAANRAETTVNQTWYTGTYGGSSESVAGIAGYIRSRQFDIRKA